MFIKVVVIAVATLAYIYLLTVVFEYCLNEASSNLLTAIGVLLFIFLTALYVGLLYFFFKKYPKSSIRYD